MGGCGSSEPPPAGVVLDGTPQHLHDALHGSLDAEGRATGKTVTAVADLVASLAQGVRGAKQAAE